jgi:tetratricopeptide (TPR) repeat protein
LANAEGRFAEALSTITAEDDRTAQALTNTSADQQMRILVIRGDAFFGLRNWSDALSYYGRVSTFQVNHVGSMARLVECQAALGRTAEAMLTLEDLARIHLSRGDELLLLGKSAAAVTAYENAITLQKASPKAGIERELSISLSHYGNALLFQGKAGAAMAEYEKAIGIMSRSENAGQNFELAKTYQNLGNSLFSQGKRDPALAAYEKALAILTALERQERTDVAGELARIHNNRGVVRRAAGNLPEALTDFERAVQLVTPGSEITDRSIAHATPGKLDVAFSYSDRGIDALILTRPAESGGWRQSSIILAVSLRNRGYARLGEGQTEGARQDFHKSTDICGKLVERDGQRDVSLEFGRSLIALAWNYATSASDSLRDGTKARRYALKACEVYEWRGFAALDSMAAACAETGAFAEAVQWQQKAVELSPPKFKSDLESRLGRYRAGQPYRAPVATRE